MNDKSPALLAGFPEGFTWGAATAAYQIEGAAATDGRGPCIWDMMCRKPGAVFRGHTGAIACDHYQFWRKDIDIMRQIGLRAYRFSVSWTRIFPSGTGVINPKGLEFYDRLVDGLLEAGIEPYLTLFHWDFPLALYRKGGWMNDDSPLWFAEYSEVLAKRLGDRVEHWITLNEPQAFVSLGHVRGIHAPGDKLEVSEALRVVHHTLLAHGHAVQAVRAGSPRKALIGASLTGGSISPASESSEDIEAARETSFETTEHLYSLSLWGDPIYLGRYPEQACVLFRDKMPPVTSEDMRIIQQPLDFMGYNCYTDQKVSRGEDGQIVIHEREAGNPVGSLAWLELGDDNCLYWAVKFQSERYGALPFLVTENGVAITDWKGRDGAVHDPQRIDYVSRYLTGLRRAAREGYSLKGYFYWSLLDNFEWADGYNPRFGLVYIDYQTKERTIKDSGHWYRTVIGANGTNL